QGTRFVVRWNCDSTCLRHFVQQIVTRVFVRDFPAFAPMTAARYAVASAAYGRLAAPFRAADCDARFCAGLPGLRPPEDAVARAGLPAPFRAKHEMAHPIGFEPMTS